MDRLFYTPKAYVFIRSFNMGRVYNISEDVVSGSVERNVNAESTATVNFRNRFRKYIVDSQTGKQIFMPMDMITIWLQRIAGKPIQVFTGYLDEAPMYQMYPGVATVKATCTLKRLSYSWFDPGLQFFQAFVNSIPGWYIDPTSGDAKNFNQLFSYSSSAPNKITDGGFGELLAKFMTQIAGWSPNSVYISDLPKDLPKIAASLWQRINADTVQALDQLEPALRKIMGVSVSSGQSGVLPNGTLSPQIELSAKAVRQACNTDNFPEVVCFVAAQAATGFDPNTSISLSSSPGADSSGNPLWGYGLYSMKPTSSTPSSRTAKAAGVTNTEGSTIQGYSIKQIMNPQTATLAFIKACRSVDTKKITSGKWKGFGSLEAQARSGNTAAIEELIQKALNLSIQSADWNSIISQANTYLSTFGHEHNYNLELASTQKKLTHYTWKSPEIQAALDSEDQKIYSLWYGGANDLLAPYYWIAKTQYHGIKLAAPRMGGNPVPASDTLVLASAEVAGGGSLGNLFNAIKSKTTFDSITYTGRGVVGSGPTTNEFIVDIWRGGNQSSITNVPYTAQKPETLAITVNKFSTYPTWDGQKATYVPQTTKKNTTTPRPGDPTSPEVTFQDMASMSLNAAFTAQFAFPFDYLKANFLTGDKELMNVISCMDGVSQFCAASMRNFMSLPGGQFLAFYPDYFGAHGRQPYWTINDIEITNGGIQFNDQSLATHVYTIGDTFGGDGQINFMDDFVSRGVVTLDMPLLLKSFLLPIKGSGDNITQDDGNPFGATTLKTASEFMNHYGARPYEEDMPQIRNSFFEFLYAYQRFIQKWAGCFNTSFSFTFQPEIMAGGIIGFPQHNLQMYVEQVSHQWDYSQGFATTAQLSSPAAMNGSQARTAQDVSTSMGIALAGSVNTVGAANG